MRLRTKLANPIMRLTFLPHAEGLQVSIRYHRNELELGYDGLVADRRSEISTVKAICRSISKSLSEPTEWGEYDSGVGSRMTLIKGLN